MHKIDQEITILGCFIWSLAALFFLYEFFLRTFVGTVADQIIPDLHLSLEAFSLLGTAYFAAYGLMQIPVGILCDKFGAKKIMIFATLMCALATFLFAHSTNFTTAFLSRFFMGFGSAFALVCLFVLTLNWFPQKYFGFFAGASQFVGTMGPILAAGPLMTVMLALHESWREALAQTGSFGIVLAVLIFLFVKNKPVWKEKEIIYLQRHEPLMIQIKRLAKNIQVWLIAFYSASVYVAISLLAAVWGTDYLDIKGFEQIYSAYIISISWVGFAIGCPVLGLISDVMKRRKPTLIFAAILGFFAILIMTFWPKANFWIFSIAFFCLGIAAAGQNVGFATIAEQVDPRVRSTALGLNNGMILFFSSIIPPIAGWMLEVAAGSHMKYLQHNDFFWMFSMLLIFYVIAFMISTIFLKETYCKPQKEVEILR